MILLDTSLLFELMRPRPAAMVWAWASERPAASLFVTALSEAELLAALTGGTFPAPAIAAARTLFEVEFAGRVLPFDRLAAECYARVQTGCRRAGDGLARHDAAIAAIALSRGAALATMRPAAFASAPIALIDPLRPS